MAEAAWPHNPRGGLIKGRDYAFGDGAIAAERLAVVAEVFEPSSLALLESLDCAPTQVVDLGCGPGHTTAMLARRFPRATVIGLDQSEAFLAIARAAQPPACRFARADVTRSRLPHGPADLIYARFLASHLPEPCALLDAWATQLSPAGLLVIEEPEAIDTDDAVFAEYLRLAGAKVAASGGKMYAGPTLAEWQPNRARVKLSRIAEHAVSASQAAAMFSLNLEVWGASAVADGLTSEQTLRRLREGLRAPRAGAGGPLRWSLRQIVAQEI